jgi:hypothetical protein
MELTYVFHEPDGSVRSELDTHVCGLFPTSTWISLLEGVGFEDVRGVDLRGDELRVGTLAFAAVRPT